MGLIDIATGVAVVLTLPLLASAIWQLKRYAEGRNPPPRRGARPRDEHAQAPLG
jgi:hypothetical protein